MIRTGAAVDASETFTFNNSKTKGRKFVRDMAKMMLRAYNAEAETAFSPLRRVMGMLLATTT